MPVQIETLSSASLQSEVPFAVIFPEGEGPFPVIYDLHGLMRWEGAYDPSPTERAFFEKVVTPFEDAREIDGKTYRSIEEWANALGVVLVKVNGGAGWYLDSPRIENSQYESHIIKELIPYVESTFPVIGTPETRGIGGHSMGGFGSISFLCRYPELFTVGATHCAALRFMPPENHRGSFIETLMSDEELRAVFPEDFLKALLRPDLKLCITVGEDDSERILGENRTLHAFLTENNQPHIYEETPGGHDYAPHGFDGLNWAAEQLKEQANGA